MGSPQDQAEAEDLSELAANAPAMVRLRAVVDFVGKGRRATQAGNLTGPDAAALAQRLGVGEQASDEVHATDDQAVATHAFQWALASEFLIRRGTKVVPGPRATDLERDPLSAWFKAALTLFEHGLLDGFRQGWHKHYVELLDAGAADLLVGLAEAGGVVALATIEEAGWEQVVAAYGYDLDDDRERHRVVLLIAAMVDRLADLGTVDRRSGEVALTDLGMPLAAMVAFAGDDDLVDLDLVDADAPSLLQVCAEELGPGEAGGHLLDWCRARPAEEAAAELCEAMLDDEDPEVWHLGLEAMGMIDRAVAEPAVRGLEGHAGLRPLAVEWLGRGG